LAWDPVDNIELILVILRLAIVITLVIVAQKSKKWAFIALALNNFLIMLSLIDSLGKTANTLWTSGFNSLSYFPSVIFIYLVFFEDRKKMKIAFAIVLALLVITTAVVVVLLLDPSALVRLSSQYVFGVTLTGVSLFIAVATLDGLLAIRKNPEVEKWVKLRYVFVILNKATFAVLGIGYVVMAVFYFTSLLVPIVTYMYYLSIIPITCDFLAWVVPTLFHKRIKRKATASDEKGMSEDEIAKQFAAGGA